MESKIKRFITLSKEFTVNGKEIYKDLTNTHYGSFSVEDTKLSGSSYVTFSQTPQKTQIETLEENTTKMVEKARRFEEYLTLQTDLSNYYKALEKLK